MATTTRVLDANVNGTVYTANANSALEALDTCHSGATAPTNEVANGKLWLDTSTTPGILKIYNNATWEVVHSGTVDINGGSIDGTTIGATTPAAVTTSALVATTADINGGTIDGTVIGGTTPAAGTFTALTSNGIDDNASATAMTLDASGNVGIGTTSPSSKLSVHGDTDAAVEQLLTIVNAGTGVGAGARIWLSGASPTSRGAYIEAVTKNSSNAHDLIFATNTSSAAPVEAMRIHSSGNLLVGTTSGSDKVTVNGTVNATTFVGDGSALTGIATISTAGSVGTYMFANNNSGGTVATGTTVAGSTLRPTAAGDASNTGYGMSGTWRLMGHKAGSSTSFSGTNECSLWLRVL